MSGELSGPTGSPSNQYAYGTGIAQASDGSTAIVTYNNYNVYGLTHPQSVDDATLSAARGLLSQLPIDSIPPSSHLPPGSRMPLTANPLFVGRAHEFMSLAKAIKVRDIASDSIVTSVIAQVVTTGLGGMGKTQLAVEFVHRYGKYFQGGVFWLSFANPDAVPAEIASCGGPGFLDLRPDYPGLALDDQVRLVLSAWQSPLPRLLVFDNCEDEALLATWRPPTGGCSVLVTSRRAQWDPTLGVHVLPLEVLPRPQSIALLRKYRPELSADDINLNAIDAIAEELGDLPLALHLAGSYLAKYRYSVTPAQYLQQLRSPRLLKHPSLQGKGATHSPTSHNQSVARTFALSYDRLDAADHTDSLALRLLHRAAYFAQGVPIPRWLLTASARQSGNSADKADQDTGNQLQEEDALSRLVGLGLLETEAEGALRMHRLIARFMRDAAADTNTETDTEANSDVETVLVEATHELNSSGYPAALLPLQPHLRAITDAALAIRREDFLVGALCRELGYHLDMTGDYKGALPLMQHAVAIYEKVLGPDHPETAYSLSNLASLLQDQGDYQAALPLQERALAVCEKVLGPDDPHTAISLNTLAMLLRRQGDYQAALPLYERALDICEKVLSPDDPITAYNLNNLALLLQELGEYEVALPLQQRALAIDEKMLGPDHPHTATSLNNLALLLQRQGDYQAALPLEQRVLTIREKVLGLDHPDTATSLSNLAGLFKDQGDYQAALPLYERALTIKEQVLGPDHPDTALSLNNLALLLQELGDYQAALPLQQRALAIYEKVLGPDHPHTATSLNNLALLLQRQGDYQAALPLYERALAIREKVLGPDHPDTAISLSNLAVLFKDQGDYQAALPLQQRALAIKEEVLGPDHPETAISLNNLVLLLQRQGDYQATLPLQQRVLTIREKVLGPDHPDTATSLNNLALLLQRQGDYQAALPLFERAVAIYEKVLGPGHSYARTARQNLQDIREAMA